MEDGEIYGIRIRMTCLLLARVVCGGCVSETVARIHVVLGVGAHARGFMRQFATGTFGTVYAPSDRAGASACGIYLPLIALHHPLLDSRDSDIIIHLRLSGALL